MYAFSNRVHVKCGIQSYNGIEYFAIPTSSSAQAGRFTTMATAALGGWMWVDWEYWDVTTGPAFGCHAHDCRPALSWQVVQ